MANDKKYISKIVKPISGVDTDLWIKDVEAQTDIAAIKEILQNGSRYIGKFTSAVVGGQTVSSLKDGDVVTSITTSKGTYVTGTPTGSEKQLMAGDYCQYEQTGKATTEWMWNGSTIDEFGSTSLLKALAFADTASTSTPYTPAGSNAASAVSFSGQADGDFVTGYDNDGVADQFSAGTLPTKAADSFSAGTLPSFTYGAFDAGELPEIQEGFVTEGSAASFTEGAFSAGTLPSFTEGAFSQGTLPSLGDPTTDTFAQAGEVSSYNESTETLTLSAAATASAVINRGTWSAGTLPSKAADTWSAGTLPSKAADTFTPNVPTAIDVNKFDAGSLPSKTADTFNAGTLPSFTEGAFTQGTLPSFTAGSLPSLVTGKAITNVGTGTAAAQVFTGTAATITVTPDAA